MKEENIKYEFEGKLQLTSLGYGLVTFSLGLIVGYLIFN